MTERPAGPDRVTPVDVALAGNPNVGKSTFFNQLTGLDVSTAHYPGTTTQVARATTLLGERPVLLTDLPGVYSLGGTSGPDRATRQAVLDCAPDALIAVVDETNLARNLYLVLQLLDFGLRPVVALNLHDEAQRHGFVTDTAALSARLGVPVLATVARHGLGVAEALELAVGLGDSDQGPQDASPRYGAAFEALLAPLVEACAGVPDRPYGLGPRALALQLLEDASDMEDVLDLTPVGRALVALARSVRSELSAVAGGAVGVVARERYAEAGMLADAVQSHAEVTPRGRDLWSLATARATGVPLLLLVLAAVFGTLFMLGGLIARGFAAVWAVAVAAPVGGLITSLFGDGLLAAMLRWGLAGVEASLGVGIPYILTFYVLLAVLQDSGYLNAVAFLADRAMHRFGLHGLAVVPLVAAAGCNVPAVLAASSLPSKRERFIASTLATMVPCSARTAVILGAVGAYAGALPAIGVFAIAFAAMVIVGLVLQGMLPGRPVGMVMEVFPFRRPTPGGVLRKAWVQFRTFLVEAVPVVVVGSVVLGGLYESGWLWRFTAVLDPVVVGWLGLPSVAGLTLLLGVLRKELALQLLVTLAVAAYGSLAIDLTSFMTQRQVFVYALVNTLAIPCVSTLAILGRRLGWARAAAIAGTTIAVALVAGGIASRVGI